MRHRTYRYPFQAAIVLLFWGLLAGIPCHGTVSVEKMENDALFGIEFPRDLAFYAVASRVAAASLQEYQTGPFMVTEVVIDIAGSPSQLRIYVTELLDPSQRIERGVREIPGSANAPRRPLPSQVEAMAERARRPLESATENLVIKDYPTSTHARTIEYRLARRSTLVEFYDRFTALWSGAASEGSDEEPITSLAGTRFNLR